MDSFALAFNMYLVIMLFVGWLRNDTCVLFCVWLMNYKVLCIALTRYFIEELLCLLAFCLSSKIHLLHTNG